MRSDRASDLHLVREVSQRQSVETGGCAPPVVVASERQQDQRVVEDQRADYLRRAEQGGASDEPVVVEWDDVKL